jgi:hypothetical protein
VLLRQEIIDVSQSTEKQKVMIDFVKVSLKVLITTAIFVLALIVAIVITSLLTQSDIHPDYCKFGTPEKATLCLLLVAYGAVVFNSLKRSPRVEKQQIKLASQNQIAAPDAASPRRRSSRTRKAIMKNIPLGFFSILLFYNSANAETVLKVASEPSFGTIDGIKYESRSISPFVAFYDIYISYRERRPGDFKADEYIWGTVFGEITPDFPNRVIHQIVLGIQDPGDWGKVEYYAMPRSLYRDLSQPTLGEIYLGQTLFALTLKNSTLTVYLCGSDAAGSYEVNWIIDIDKLLVRRLVQPGECEVKDISKWQKLIKINKPKIIQTKKING